MPTWIGTLTPADLGTGVWVLQTDDGRTLQLHGDVPEGLAGQRVEVRGQEEAAFGFGMAGPTVKVERIRRR